MTKYKVFVTRPDISQEVNEMLRKVCDVEFYKEPKTIPREVLIKGIQGKDIIYCLPTDKIDSEVLDAAGQQLKVIVTNSVGYDHIDINECKKRDILVGNTPGIPTDSVAELTVALMLITGRRLFEASNAIKNGEWVHVWAPYWMCGVGLKNATVGIVGMGKIGQAVAERILSFKVNEVVYYDIHKPVNAVESMGARYVEFEDLLRKSDFVLCTCNLTDKTTELFTAKQFNLMKSTAIFINTSRGKVVQHDDLYDALKHGKIRAAGLDVMIPEPIPKDHRLTTLPNLVLLPHIGTAEVTVRQNMAKLAARNVLSYCDGKGLITPIPELKDVQHKVDKKN